MIDRLRVQNYKVLKDLELHLRPMNLLVGPNGSGKSSIVEVLLVFQNMSRTGFSFEEDLPKIFRWLIMGGLKAALTRGQEDMLLAFTHTEHGEFAIQLAMSGTGNPYPSQISCNGKTQPLTECSEIREFVRTWRIHKFENVYKMGRDYQQLTYVPGENDRYVLTKGENVAQVLLGLKIRHDKLYNRIKGIFLEAISDQAPEADLRLDLEDMVLLNLEMSRSIWGSDWELAYRDWPDGWKKFLALLVSLETANNLFVIEEPENYLHPGLLAYFMELLKERVQEGLQVIITTHSPVLVNLISDTPEALVMVNAGKARRVDQEDRNYLKKVNKLLGTAYFGGLLDDSGDS